MSFRSLYRHGFARVAACTTRTALADPATNAAAILTMARDCDAPGGGSGGISRTRHLRLRDQRSVAADTLLDAVEAAIETHHRRIGRANAVAAGGRAAAASGRAVQRAARHASRPVAGRRAENPFAELPGVLRTAPFRQRRRRRGRVITIGGAHRAVRHRSVVGGRRLSRPHRSCRDLRGYLGSATHPAARRRWRGRQCWRICRRAISPSARPRPAGCCASRNRRGVWRPISMPPPGPASRPPTSLGTARPRCSRTARRWPRPNGFPPADQAAIADIDLDMLRAGTVADGIVRRPTAAARSRAARSGDRFRHRSAAGRCRLPAADRAVSVRAGRCRAAGAGLLRGLQHPGLRPGAAAARDGIEDGW